MQVYWSSTGFVLSIGSLTLSGAIDYETKNSYELTVVMTDVIIPSMPYTTTINIDIIDVNDNVPIFEKTSYHFEVTNLYNIA